MKRLKNDLSSRSLCGDDAVLFLRALVKAQQWWHRIAQLKLLEAEQGAATVTVTTMVTTLEVRPPNMAVQGGAPDAADPKTADRNT